MRNQENQLEANDIGLLIVVLVAGWLLLFQSGLFQITGDNRKWFANIG